MVNSVKIKDFPNYSITETGVVYSHNYRNTGKTKKLSLSKKDGYFIVGLNKNNKRYSKKVHRLVAEAFIPNPDNKPQINHKNGIRCEIEQKILNGFLIVKINITHIGCLKDSLLNQD